MTKGGQSDALNATSVLHIHIVLLATAVAFPSLPAPPPPAPNQRAGGHGPWAATCTERYLNQQCHVFHLYESALGQNVTRNQATKYLFLTHASPATQPHTTYISIEHDLLHAQRPIRGETAGDSLTRWVGGHTYAKQSVCLLLLMNQESENCKSTTQDCTPSVCVPRLARGEQAGQRGRKLERKGLYMWCLQLGQMPAIASAPLPRLTTPRTSQSCVYTISRTGRRCCELTTACALWGKGAH